MNYVIPVGIADDYMRFSLRSIEKYCTGFDDIIVVGKLPAWCCGIGFYEMDDNSKLNTFRDDNIRRKFMFALDLFGRIVGGNDDYVYTKPTDLSTLPYYYRENDLQSTIDRHKGGWRQYQNTRDFLVKKGKDVKMYDTHCPIIYEKCQFEAVNSADWQIPYGFGIKSLYGNLNDKQGVFLEDSKVMINDTQETIEKYIKNSFLVSFASRMNPLLLKYLEKEFPHKSKWEK